MSKKILMVIYSENQKAKVAEEYLKTLIGKYLEENILTELTP